MALPHSSPSPSTALPAAASFRLVVLPDGTLLNGSNIAQITVASNVVTIALFAGTTLTYTLASDAEAAAYFIALRVFLTVQRASANMFPDVSMGTLAITSLSPTTVPVAGNVPLLITGTGFLPTASVSIAGTFYFADWVNATTLSVAKVPPHAAGVVSVAVMNPGGSTVTLASSLTYA